MWQMHITWDAWTKITIETVTIFTIPNGCSDCERGAPGAPALNPPLCRPTDQTSTMIRARVSRQSQFFFRHGHHVGVITTTCMHHETPVNTAIFSFDQHCVLLFLSVSCIFHYSVLCVRFYNKYIKPYYVRSDYVIHSLLRQRQHIIIYKVN